MKVKKNIKPVKSIRSKPKQELKQNQTKRKQKKKLGNIFNLDKSVNKFRSSGEDTKSTRVKTISLKVNMDTSVDTSVPSLIEIIGCQEGINNGKGYYVQQLSELVSPVHLKKKNSEIGRLPCKYKLKKKQRLIEKVPSKVVAVLEDNLEKCTAVDGIEFHVLNDSKVMLIMTAPMLLYFNGSLKVQVLMGGVEVLGYLINSSSDVQTVYSTRGTSHLCLKAIMLPQSLRSEQYFATEKSMIEQFLGLRMKDVDKMSIISKLNETRVVIILHKNKDIIYSEIWPKFLFEHCSSYSIFPQKNNFLNNKNRTFSVVENILNCLFELSSSNVTTKKFNELAEWSEIENEIIFQTRQLTPRTVLVGGKSVGKSTFLRYMVNKSLKKWEKVLVFDFDIGQSEFTLPGCVSAVLVEKPLLGTNFTHLMDPVRSVFVGDIDAVQCLQTYMEGFQQVLNFCKEQPMLNKIPWFVNTMGFCKALGFSITVSIIQQVSPTHVVQIQSRDKSNNFEKQLKPPVVSRHRFGNYSRPFARLDYTLLYIPSAAEEKEGKSICSSEWGMKPKQARQLVLFSYLSKMLTSQSLNLLELAPYMVSISKLYLEVHQTTMTQKQALFTMNGNLVALCCKSQNNEELPNCLGFGIVRGVDYDNDHLYLITPLKLAKLQDVNCLVKGNISLPESFLLESQGQSEGHVPFVAYTSKTHTTQPVKREFNPMKEKAGTHIKNY